MRAYLIAIALLTAEARADEFEEPIEARHPEWKMRMATTSDVSGNESTETWRYEADGTLGAYYYKDAKRDVADYYWWDADGRLVRHKQGAESREFAYKLDASGRVVVREIRDPSHADTFVRETSTWASDGSRTVERARVDTIGQSYPDGSEAYDARGRRTRDCSSTTCSMYEYDAHDRVSRVRVQVAGGEHHYRVYERDYDTAGRMTREKVGGTETKFFYDTRELRGTESYVDGKWASRTRYVYTRR